MDLQNLILILEGVGAQFLVVLVVVIRGLANEILTPYHVS